MFDVIRCGIQIIRLYCRALTDLLFPRVCIVCGDSLLLYEDHLCTACLAELPYTYFWTFKDNPAEKVFIGRVHAERVLSLFYYTHSYKQMVHSLKYRSNVQIGLWLGELLGEKIGALLSGNEMRNIDYIIPVPLHWRKQWKRGYNQSEIIAKGVVRGIAKKLAESSKKEMQKECASRQTSEQPIEPVTAPKAHVTVHKAHVTVPKVRVAVPQVLTGVLKRVSFTQTQTHKERHNRWLNVCNAFALDQSRAEHHNLSGKHCLIIDDVLTTGATLDACASILVEQLGCKVSIATLAYVE